jgi:DTW domain-containing protein YfiP
MTAARATKAGARPKIDYKFPIPSVTPDHQRIPETPFEPRVVCTACGRPASVCLCAEFVRVATRTRVVILQHPRESIVPIGTARLAELALPNSERHVGVEFGESRAVKAALANPAAPPILLFPGPGARDLAREPPAGPVTLVVLDGTWWQAQKLLKKNPDLLRLPRYSLAPEVPSRYRIRREPAAHCVSTIEAIVEALVALEGGDGVRALLRPFDAMVEQQLRFASEERARRHLARPRAAKRQRFPAALGERSADLVIGYGETNAWPRGSPLGDASEVVHLALERVVSGERFEAFIAPRRPLSPSFSHHTGLSDGDVLGAPTFDAFVARLGAFLRPTDLLGGWGYFWSHALAREGVALPELVDLRALAREHLDERTGDVLECAAKLGEPPPVAWARGRTGRRAAGATAVARALVRSAGGR